MVKEWKTPREAQDLLAYESHKKAAAAYDAGFYDDLIVPFAGLERDNNLRPDITLEKLASLGPAFDRKSGHGTLTAGNSTPLRSEEHTSELQSLMRISYAVFCLKKKKNTKNAEIIDTPEQY